MTVQSFRLRNFRVLCGPQFGTYADEDGVGVRSPAGLSLVSHRHFTYAAPDAYGVQVGLGILFSEGLVAEDHVVRVDVQNDDRTWSEYDPASRQHQAPQSRVRKMRPGPQPVRSEQQIEHPRRHRVRKVPAS